MLESLLSAIVQFFIQPLFLVGLVYAIWLNRSRINYERDTFSSAIYRGNEEIKSYLLAGLLPGIILSVVAVGLGITVSVDWLIIYQLVSIVLLVFGPRFVHPIYTFPISAGISWLVYNVFGDAYSSQSLFQTAITDFSTENFTNIGINWLVLLVTLIIVGGILLARTQYKLWTPYYMMSKRGIKVASYRIQEFTMIPLLLVVPGDAFTAFAEWWPVFSIGNETYTFFLLPILFGLRFTTQSHTPTFALNKVNKEFSVSGVIVLFGLLLAIFVADIFVWITLALAFILGAVVLIRHRLNERDNVVLYSPADEGVRIIGIRPDTPADRLNVNIGDVILNVNEIAVNEEVEVQQALEKNRSFVYLRLKRSDGEIILDSASLYKEDPYDLGFILLTR